MSQELFAKELQKDSEPFNLVSDDDLEAQMDPLFRSEREHVVLSALLSSARSARRVSSGHRFGSQSRGYSVGICICWTLHSEHLYHRANAPHSQKILAGTARGI